MALSLHHLGEASQGRAMGLDPQPGALTGASWAGWRRVAVARWGFFGGVSTNGPMYCQHCGLDQLKFGKELGRLPDRGQQTSSIGSQESRTFRLTVENGGIEKEPTSSRLIANPAASGLSSGASAMGRGQATDLPSDLPNRALPGRFCLTLVPS